jgi:ABC-type nitrate/sulfonate/bicarbonate transport system ATPase subunit
MVSPAGTTPKIEARDLYKSYSTASGPLAVVGDVSLAADEGEFVSIIGPSGCGKSTIFNIMAGLEPADAGAVLVDGAPVTAVGRTFGYMPQKDLLFPWRRLLENTTLGLEVQGVPRGEARDRALQLFEAFGLTGFERAYPSELSGGMRQRAALLRTVVQEREVVLLDEPLGALDSLTRMQMQEWLEEVWRRFRWTVLLITHDIREAVYLSDRVYVMTARPGGMRMEVAIDLPRPRSREIVDSEPFRRLERELTEALRVETGKAERDAVVWPA